MFLSCGDCLFDVFARPAEESDVSTVSLTGRVGGSPLNVALGLARLGHSAGFLTKLSGDLFGLRIRAFMEREGIDTRFLIPTTRNTTLAMVSLAGDGSARYDFYIEGTADRSVEISDLPALPEAVTAIHVGSYSTVVEPTASALRTLLARESGKRFISYDPNIRASIEPDLDLWRSRVRELASLASLVKASEEDLDLLFPGRPVEDVLAEWVSLGAPLAVATRGGDGAIALSRSGARTSVSGLVVPVADTVGAGDTFQAALLAKLHEDDRLSNAALDALDGDDLSALLAFAVKAAAVTCTRRGADLPRRADLGLPPLAG